MALVALDIAGAQQGDPQEAGLLHLGGPGHYQVGKLTDDIADKDLIAEQAEHDHKADGGDIELHGLPDAEFQFFQKFHVSNLLLKVLTFPWGKVPPPGGG